MLKTAYIIIFISLLVNSAFSQTDLVRWGKADYKYEKPDNFRHRDYGIEAESVSGFISKVTANAYWFFISDLDGDNCPFRPSCSSFFVEASKETNIVQGTLMFFDRFTRDFSIYKRHEHYPRVKDGHYYDPVDWYKLEKDEINYIPPGVVVSK